MRNILKLIPVLLAAQVCMAQHFVVQAAPFSPLPGGYENSAGFILPIMAIEVSAHGGDGALLGLDVRLVGTADYVVSLDPAQPASLWRDDGDGQLGTATDAPVAPGALVSNHLQFTLFTPDTILNGTAYNYWICLNVFPLAGGSRNETMGVVLEAAADVSATVPVQPLGSPIESGLSLIVKFSVQWGMVTCGASEDSVLIAGTGFTSPAVVTVGGITMPGATVARDGTLLEFTVDGSYRTVFQAWQPYDVTIETDILGVRWATQIAFCDVGFGPDQGKPEPLCTATPGGSFPGALAMIALLCMLVRITATRPSTT